MRPIDLYRKLIEPSVDVYRVRRRVGSNTLGYHEGPNVYREDMKLETPVYIDACVFISFLIRSQNGGDHKQWLDSLALLALVDTGVYEAVTNTTTFDFILPNVLRRELKLKQNSGIEKEALIYRIVLELRKIGGLTIYDEKIEPVRGLVEMGEPEDAFHLAVAIQTRCGIFVTYDSDFLNFMRRQNYRGIKVMKPEQLIPPISTLEELEQQLS